MKRITLRQLELLNFKGIEALTIEFDPEMTTISGGNGTGKTTVFDAFTWVLFGKDSQDRKQFEIKTLREGVAIPRLTHSVVALLSVDGQELRLERRYKEKWSKRRGEQTEVLTGHEEERLWNDVPLSVKEWSEKMEELIPEQLFKFITNPRYFTSQKADVQREMLFRMIGQTSDEDFAKRHQEFATLIASLSGKTTEEAKRELQAKKRRVKEQLDPIPSRIDEVKRMQPAAKDWEEIEAEIEEMEKEQARMDAAIESGNADLSKAATERDAQLQQLAGLKTRLAHRIGEVEDAVHQDYNAQLHALRKQQSDLLAQTAGKNAARLQLSQQEARLAQLSAHREELLATYREIKGAQPSFSEADFTCPTCHRPFEPTEIEVRRSEIILNFGRHQAAQLEENMRKGKGIKVEMEAAEQSIAQLTALLAEMEKAEAALKQLLSQIEAHKATKPDATAAIAADTTAQELRAQIVQLEEATSRQLQAVELVDLKAEREQLRTALSALRVQLSERERIAKGEKRIKELERTLRHLSQELAELEGRELELERLSIAKAEDAEARINALFDVVKFRLFRRQVNGELVETCEATVMGVPFSTINNAAQINAGLDIIRTFSAHEGISAPIFVDNAESVNNLLRTPAQTVRLAVDNHPKLSVRPPIRDPEQLFTPLPADALK